MEEYIYSSEVVPEFSSILVPNVDNVRTNFLIDTIAKQYKVIIKLINHTHHTEIRISVGCDRTLFSYPQVFFFRDLPAFQEVLLFSNRNAYLYNEGLLIF